jgi:hypothetical protein
VPLQTETFLPAKNLVLALVLSLRRQTAILFVKMVGNASTGSATAVLYLVVLIAAKLCATHHARMKAPVLKATNAHVTLAILDCNVSKPCVVLHLVIARIVVTAMMTVDAAALCSIQEINAKQVRVVLARRTPNVLPPSPTWLSASVRWDTPELIAQKPILKILPWTKASAFLV